MPSPASLSDDGLDTAAYHPHKRPCLNVRELKTAHDIPLSPSLQTYRKDWSLLACLKDLGNGRLVHTLV